MKKVILQIRDSIDALAASKGWSREDYRIEMILNIAWRTILVSLFAKEYTHERMQSDGAYDEVLDKLETDLQTEPGLYEAISVLLWPWIAEDQAASIPLDESHVNVDNKLLNPGLSDARTPSPI